MYLYKHQVEYYKKTVYDILLTDIEWFCQNLRMKRQVENGKDKRI